MANHCGSIKIGRFLSQGPDSIVKVLTEKATRETDKCNECEISRTYLGPNRQKAPTKELSDTGLRLEPRTRFVLTVH